MAKAPSGQTKWKSWLTHGSLVLMLIASAATLFHASGKLDQAAHEAQEVPALVSQIEQIQKSLDSIEHKQDAAMAIQDNRLNQMQNQINALVRLDDKVNTIQGQMGSVWALAQSDSNKVSKLEGMLTAMQTQMSQQKEK